MANLTKTVTNSIRSFGPAPSTKWGGFTWGAGNWGEKGANLTRAIGKLISNTQLSDSTISKQPSVLAFQESLAFTFEASHEYLSQGDYFYVFPKPSTDAEERALTTYTSVSRQSTTYTSMVTATTVWS